MTDREHRDSGAADRAAVVRPEGSLTAGRGAPHQDGAPRWRLRAAIEPFFASDGDVYLLRGTGAREHVIRAPGEHDRELLARLAHDGVGAATGSPEHARLAPLIDAGIVVAEPELEQLGSDAARFARQLPYLEDFGDPVGAQRRLRGSSICIVGCGGLGTWALVALAGLGIGRFVLVDDDVVDLSNLNRQVIYRARDLGRDKVQLAAEWLAAFDPEIEVETYRRRVRGSADVAAVVSACDLLVLTADWPPYELNRWVNRACLARGVPFISAGQQPPLLKVGPTYVPGRGACFACSEHHLRADYPLYDELVEQRSRRPPQATTLGPASGIIGAVLAVEVLHLLMGHWPLATHDRVLLFDMRTLQSRFVAIERHPDCHEC